MPRPRKPRPYKPVWCVDRDERHRPYHSLDKDGVCIFCDRTRDEAHAADRRYADMLERQSRVRRLETGAR